MQFPRGLFYHSFISQAPVPLCAGSDTSQGSSSFEWSWKPYPQERDLLTRPMGWNLGLWQVTTQATAVRTGSFTCSYAFRSSYPCEAFHSPLLLGLSIQPAWPLSLPPVSCSLSEAQTRKPIDSHCIPASNLLPRYSSKDSLLLWKKDVCTSC